MSEQFTRRDFLKLSGSMMATAVIPDLGAKSNSHVHNGPEGAKNLETTQLKYQFVEASNYPGHTNLVIGFTENQEFGDMIHIELQPTEPTTSTNNDRSKRVNTRDAIILNPIQLSNDGTNLIDATPISKVGPITQFVTGSGREIDATTIRVGTSYEAVVQVTAECFVSESKSNGEYKDNLEKERDKMMKLYGSDIVSGELVLDFMVNEKNEPIGKRVTIYGPDGRIAKRLWVNTLETNPENNVDIKYNDNDINTRRGDSQFELKVGAESPFLEVELIPLNTKGIEFSETVEGVTTTISLNMDSSMEMKARDEKADEFAETNNFPGGSNSAMNQYARSFIHETAILTNQNTAGMSQKEFLAALAIAQMNPNDDNLWEKLELNIYNDATKKMERVRVLPNTKLDLVFAYSNKIDGCTSTWDDGWNEGLRTEISGNVVRIIRSIDNYGYDATAFRPFVHHMSALPNLLGKYNGQRIKNFNVGANHSKTLIKAINIFNTYVCAFKVLFKGKPASITEATKNP